MRNESTATQENARFRNIPQGSRRQNSGNGRCGSTKFQLDAKYYRRSNFASETVRQSKEMSASPISIERLCLNDCIKEREELREMNAELLEACNQVLTWVALACARDPLTTHPQALKNAENDFAMLRALLAKAEKLK